MPVLRFRKDRLTSTLGLELDAALALIERLKGEVSDAGDYVEVEFELDRPDLYTVEGIRRAADGLLGRELGLPEYKLVDSGIEIVVDEVPTRPYVEGFVVWGVDVDEVFLEELIQFQEKLHQSLGGNRARVAIGIHDLAKLPSKTIVYRFEDVDNVVFEPLGYGRRMSLREVLASTKHGELYGRLALANGRHPVLYAGGEVISVTPVINAELTRVEPGTRDLFVDVTGTDPHAVSQVANVLAANLAERGGRRIGLVRLRVGNGTVARTPRFTYRRIVVSASSVSRWLGVHLDAKALAYMLRMARFNAVPLSDGETVEAVVPPYRVDIIGWVDVAEEAAIVLGSYAVTPRKPVTMLRGSSPGYRYFEREVREVLVGLGFTEVLTYSLVPCTLSRDLLGLEAVRLSNPLGPETGCYRASIAANLLRVVKESQHTVPVKVFELGEVARVVSGGRIEPRKVIGLAMADYKVGFEDVQAAVYALLGSVGLRIEAVREFRAPGLIEGRAAVVRASEGVEAVIGEVHPELLERMGISYPVAIAEVDYTGLARRMGWAAAVPRP